MDLKLWEEVGNLRKTNGILKMKIETISATDPASHMGKIHWHGVMWRHQRLLRAAQTYKDAMSAGCLSLPRNTQLSADFVIDRKAMSQASIASGTLKNGRYVAVIADDGFTVVTRTEAKKEITSTSSQARKKNKQPVTGIRHASSLPNIVKRIKIKSLFVSRFTFEVPTTDIEKSLLDQLKFSSPTRTRLKTKFQTYASFQVSVAVEDYPSISNAGVWPHGCLTYP